MGMITLLVTLPGMLLGLQILPVPIEPALPNLSQPQPLSRAFDVTNRLPIYSFFFSLWFGPFPWEPQSLSWTKPCWLCHFSVALNLGEGTDDSSMLWHFLKEALAPSQRCRRVWNTRQASQVPTVLFNEYTPLYSTYISFSTARMETHAAFLHS